MSLSALVDQIVFCQNAVHGAPGTKVDLFVEEAGVDLSWRTVAKALAIEHGKDAVLLAFAKGTLRRWPVLFYRGEKGDVHRYRLLRATPLA